MMADITKDPAEWFNAKALEQGWQTQINDLPTFERPELNDLYKLWCSLVPAGGLPARDQLTARLMKPYMRYLAIYAIERDVAGTQHYRHRFIGTALSEVFGNLTGKTFEDFLPPPLVQRTHACFDTVLAASRPMRVVTRYGAEQASHLAAEIFAAPLAPPGQAPNMVMTVSYFLLPSAWKPGHSLINATLP